MTPRPCRISPSSAVWTFCFLDCQFDLPAPGIETSQLLRWSLATIQERGQQPIFDLPLTRTPSVPVFFFSLGSHRACQDGHPPQDMRRQVLPNPSFLLMALSPRKTRGKPQRHYKVVRVLRRISWEEKRFSIRCAGSRKLESARGPAARPCGCEAPSRRRAATLW